MSPFMYDEFGVERDLWCRIWGTLAWLRVTTLDSGHPTKAISSGVRGRRGRIPGLAPET